MSGAEQDDQHWHIDVDRRSGGTVITVAGELDMATAPELADALATAIEKPVPDARIVVVDLRSVGFLGSAGIAAVVRAASFASESGAAVRVVVGSSRKVRRPLQICGADETLDLYSTTEDALAPA